MNRRRPDPEDGGPEPVAPGATRLPLEAACAADLAELARRRYPGEACGLLIGTAEPPAVRAVVEVDNVHPRPREAFDLDPVGVVEAEARAGERGWTVLGAWHSHPDRPATPSDADREGEPPGGWHLIVPVSARGAGPPRAWRRRGGELREVPIEAR